MDHLVAIEFDSYKEAEEVRRGLGHEAMRRPVGFDDTAIVYRDSKRRVKLGRTKRHGRAGLLLGGIFGVFFGLLLPLPSVPASILSGVFGAGIGALGAKLIDEQYGRDLVNEVGTGVERGKSVLLMLVDEEAIDAVLCVLAGYTGNLVKTSVSPKTEERIQAVLKCRNNAA